MSEPKPIENLPGHTIEVVDNGLELFCPHTVTGIIRGPDGEIKAEARAMLSSKESGYDPIAAATQAVGENLRKGIKP